MGSTQLLLNRKAGDAFESSASSNGKDHAVQVKQELQKMLTKTELRAACPCLLTKRFTGSIATLASNCAMFGMPSVQNCCSSGDRPPARSNASASRLRLWRATFKLVWSMPFSSFVNATSSAGPSSSFTYRSWSANRTRPTRWAPLR